MDYNHIKNYLEKFKTLLFSKEENLKIISIILEKNISLKIETKFISIKAPFIYIKASPLVHNEIMMHKEKILFDISQIIKETKFKDIY
ncbi:MAG: hypothetical protein UR85_C0002G0056 [Candidatus Nomurabacteria bacterium GW2011_GWF2_35_66]|uniref:Uncharacterized protein n=1 Tax=Candidatus Nomurabacteria bacterium GW2011_GWE1_35_16 TaxID=1618761 RepID=A0A0G0DUF9_9BACT|nr:MAG: hypothetical protein UR55_C0004G0016 [Candidatus Nomurabacteria bacterium GW2011_GWF1_34_20]KKP63455.1 MAG: hypothetical protein UR57_C0004G0016 [Candidatus Nomurabacteria bacterium GW2011_GWE2_34_25]KKP66635.1 MAG: hypothetical protein UR64_C0004G0016 [Candidatus Nomurabacteria bacterium GW2011_GWE1_35_16]KKP83743.1 MAG: hypothetical protein UR85_C0002G0056 [Candidatus Nomurabacteria bacterium GW2011_GWF2_35_66]HAE36432.1 hypothetical protein [Candidatus Nomurabacteria bacterium]